MCVKDPEGNEIFGVYVGVSLKEGAKLGIGVGPWEKWAGNAGRYLLIVEERPGLAPS